MNESIVDDHTWQEWADELAELQKNYPEECNMNFYDEYFKDWDGSSGYHLPLRDPWVYGKAKYILELTRNGYGSVRK